MKTITVIIQGEKCMVQAEFEIEKLNKLKAGTLDRSSLSFIIGKSLDRIKSEISEAKKEEFLGLLSLYVANLTSYEIMIATNLNCIFITSFRAPGSSLAYQTRIAGVLNHCIEDSLINLSDSDRELLKTYDVGYLLLLKIIYRNSYYKKDKYHSKSKFNIVLSQANRLGEKIRLNLPNHILN
jgi:hypothetical protein